MKFRKRPVVVEAFEWDGKNANGLAEWGGMALVQVGRLSPGDDAHLPFCFSESGLTIGTLEGPHFANVGDWIICGVHGEFYPCKPDIFAKTYEAAE